VNRIHLCTNWPFYPWDGLHFFIHVQSINFFWFLSNEFFLGAIFSHNPNFDTMFTPRYLTNLHLGPTFQLIIGLPTYLSFIFSLAKLLPSRQKLLSFFWLNLFFLTKSISFYGLTFMFLFLSTKLLSFLSKTFIFFG